MFISRCPNVFPGVIPTSCSTSWYGYKVSIGNSTKTGPNKAKLAMSKKDAGTSTKRITNCNTQIAALLWMLWPRQLTWRTRCTNKQLRFHALNKVLADYFDAHPDFPLLYIVGYKSSACIWQPFVFGWLISKWFIVVPRPCLSKSGFKVLLKLNFVPEPHGTLIIH